MSRAKKQKRQTYSLPHAVSPMSRLCKMSLRQHLYAQNKADYTKVRMKLT